MNYSKRTLLVKVANPKELTDLIANSKKEITNHSAEIEVLSVNKMPGIAETEFTLELAFTISTGVASGIIASWIYSKIMQPKSRKIFVQKEKTTLIKKEDLEILIEEMEKEISKEE